ncbi:MAG: hypothetical protein ACPHID_01420 [Thermoplasmatota archaeon]
MKLQLLTAVLLAATLAGCTGDDLYDNPMNSFGDVMAHPGDVHEAIEGGDVRLKVIEPNLDHAHAGEQRLVVAFYLNGTQMLPLTDLEITGGEFGYATMAPMMAHGCGCDEPELRHVGHGVYISETDFIHAGQWRLQFLTTYDGQDLTFDVPFEVGGNDHDHGHDEGSMDHGHMDG